MAVDDFDPDLEGGPDEDEAFLRDVLPEEEDPFGPGGTNGPDGTDEPDGPGSEMPTVNTLIEETTTAYLQGIDMDSIPSPKVIERELLSRINAEIEIQNTLREKHDKLRTLRRLTFGQIAQIMLKLHRICRIGPSQKNTDRDYDLLAMYMDSGEDAGIYVTSDDHFRTVARKYDYQLTIRDFQEVHAAIKDAAPRAYRNTDRDLIAVNNGIFDFRTKQLLDFDPKYVFTSKSRVDYISGAPLPVIDTPDGDQWDPETWIASLSDDEGVPELLWEITSAILRPHVSWNKFAMLYSKFGNNGKGTLCTMWRNVTGPTTYASIPIADFGKDFMLEPLTRAQAIIVDENDVGAFIDKAANLKAVVTGDVIQINRKFKTPIAYQFEGFMVQCVNDFPRIKDKSESFSRRQLIIPMRKNFTGSERRYIKDDYLHRPEVLQYFLHRALHMEHYVLSEPQATVEVLDEYKEFNDPVRAFWSEFSDRFVWDLLPNEFLYELYGSWFSATRPAGKPLGKNTFIDDLRQVAEADGQWTYSEKCRTSKRMDRTEMLINEFDLKNWMNPAYNGPDMAKRAAPMLKASYRGLQRVGSVSALPCPDRGSANG